MLRVVLIVVALLAGVGIASAYQPQTGDSPKLMVVSRSADGKRQGAFAPRVDPYQPSRCCAFAFPAGNFKGVTGPDSVMISAFGYYAWEAAGSVHVQVAAMVPRPGAPNRYLWHSDQERMQLQPRTLSSFVLTLNKAQPVEDMRVFGLRPDTLTLERYVASK